MTETKPPKHVEVEDFKGSAAEAEPTETDFNIHMSLPDRIEIKMVDASALSDYEIWFFVSGLAFSILVGFLVASIQEKEPYPEKILIVVTIIFGIIFAASLSMTLVRRHRLTSKFRTIQLRTTRAALKPPK